MTKTASRSNAPPSLEPFTDAERRLFQLFRDINGVVYLRTALGPGKDEAQFIVNKGFSVELVRIGRSHWSGAGLNLTAIADASIYEAAKRYLTPLNDNVTISQRAKTILERILGDEKMKTAATEKEAKPAKFASNITAPAPKKAKAEKPAKPAKAEKKSAKKAAESNGVGRKSVFDPAQKISAKFDAKNPPYREGSARMNLLSTAAKSGTVAKYLAAAGDPSGGSATSYLNLFVKEGHLAVV